jgi:hypothetical protein
MRSHAERYESVVSSIEDELLRFDIGGGQILAVQSACVVLDSEP